MGVMLWIVPFAAAAEPAAPLVDEIAAALGRCRGAHHPLPELTAAQRADLAASEVVRIVRHGDPKEPSTAVGVAVLEASRDALWIAAQDLHAQVDPDLTEFVIERRGADSALWYGHIDLPRPLRDRQWVVSSDNSHDLARASGDRCWEHRWRLVEDGLPRARSMVVSGQVTKITLDHVDSAVYTPVNHGAWLMAPLSGSRTLVAYQATSVVGGAIPDWLVLQLSMSRLASVLDDLERRAQTWAPDHYRDGHPPVMGGGGEAIPLFR